MKNIKIIFGLITLTIFQSCNVEEFLETKTEGNVIYDNYFANAQEAESAVNGIYSVLQWDHVHGQIDWVYGDVMSDDTYKGGSGDEDQPEMKQMEEYIHNSGNSFISKTWHKLYVGIYRANVVLDKIDDVGNEDITQGQRERLRAEAKYLRAYFYFRLNIMFGGVPLITELLPADELVQPRASKAEVWAQIEKDLTEALPYLPAQKNVVDTDKGYDPATDMGRVTQGAVHALLAKSYLYQEKWAQSRSECELIIASNEYKLLDTISINKKVRLDHIFSIDNEDNEESIFEIHCKSIKGDYRYNEWGDGDMGTLMNIYWLSRKHGGWGFNIPTDDLETEFESGDYRRASTIAKPNHTMPYTELTPYDVIFNGQKRAPCKYIVPVAYIKNPEFSQGPSNFKIFRYADILLMHAEACAQLGDTIGGMTSPAGVSLMKVRTRAGFSTMAPNVIPNMKFDDGTFKDVVIGASFLEKIYHERRVELALEGQRFFDLVRWGLAQKELGPLGYKPHNALFPIPVGEIDVSGGIVTQNPGY